MKKLSLALLLLPLLAVTACGGKTDSATASAEATTSSSSTVASAPATAQTSSPAPTLVRDHVGKIDSGTTITARVVSNGAYSVSYKDAEGKSVFERFQDGTPFEVTIPDVTTLWSIQASYISGSEATEIRCEILVDGKVIAWQTQAENENQQYPTAYCAVSLI